MIDLCFHDAVGGESLMAKSKLGIDFVFPLLGNRNVPTQSDQTQSAYCCDCIFTF